MSRIAFWQSQFQQSASEPEMWLREGLRLCRAADHLFGLFCADLNQLVNQLGREDVSPLDFPNLELDGAASLLYGLALENLFKGLIIQGGASVIANWRIRFGGGSGHNLVSLAAKAPVSLSADEEDLVRRLTRYVEWAGRYPVAKSPDHMALQQKNITPEWFPLSLQQGEVPLYRALFFRTQARFSA